MSQSNLFENSSNSLKMQPLAALLRPQNISDILGQNEILGTGTSLIKNLKNGFLPNLILWGPPGSGKTTLALALSQASGRTRKKQTSTVWSKNNRLCR
jgi:putative ATPase